jgi:hypothetical protein
MGIILNEFKSQNDSKILNELKRFNQLLESTMGDVKPLIFEQDSERTKFYETSYVAPLVESGYKEVSEINLPDGEYNMGGSGYRIEINQGDIPTGYVLVVRNGIRGMWSGPITVSDKKVDEEVYKIFYKNVGYNPESFKPISIVTSNLTSGSIPKEVIDAPAPSVDVVNGVGVFSVGGKKYSFNFSDVAPNINGKLYMFSETGDNLNSDGKFQAKPGTHWVAFVDRTQQGTIIYVNTKGKITVEAY